MAKALKGFTIKGTLGTIKIEETESHELVRIIMGEVVTCLDPESWLALCDLRYSITVEESPPELEE